MSNEDKSTKLEITTISEKTDFATSSDKEKEKLIHNRVFLDSSPEYHLSPSLVFSYLLLFHKKNYFLSLFRRILFLFTCWFLIAFIVFISSIFYTAMLRSNAMKFQIETLDNVLNALLHERHHKFNPFRTKDIHPRMYMTLFAIPGILSGIQLVTMAFIFFTAEPIASKLYWTDNAKFLWFQMPEVPKKLEESKHKKSKPSAKNSDEINLYQNMVARLKLIGTGHFWKFWWNDVVCVPLNPCSEDNNNPTLLSRMACKVLWYTLRLPFCLFLVIFYALPIFSVWHNLVFNNKKLFCTNQTLSVITRYLVVRIVLTLVAVAGILLTYFMFFDLLILFGQVSLIIFCGRGQGVNFQIFTARAYLYLISLNRSVKDILRCFKLVCGTSGFGML